MAEFSSSLEALLESAELPKWVVEKALKKVGKRAQKIIVSRFQRQRGPWRKWKKISKATKEIFKRQYGKARGNLAGVATGALLRALEKRGFYETDVTGAAGTRVYGKLILGANLSGSDQQKLKSFQEDYWMELFGTGTMVHHPARRVMSFTKKEIREFHAILAGVITEYRATLLRKVVSRKQVYTFKISL